MFAKPILILVLSFQLIFGAVFYKSCDGSKALNFATTLRVVIAAGAPILTQFVQQGKISEDFKGRLVTDLNEEATHVTQLGSCFDAVPEDGTKNAKKAAKLQCVQTFQQQTRTVLARNFRLNPTVSNIADDIDAVIQAAIIFYGGVVPGVHPGAKPIDEDEIKARIEKLKHSLGQE